MTFLDDRKINTSLKALERYIINCQSYMEEGELKTFMHFPLHCPAFASLSLKHRCSHNFGESGEITGISVTSTDLWQAQSCSSVTCFLDR